MNLFHSCDWVEIHKTYTPYYPSFTCEKGSAYTVERLMFGVTTILFQCSFCKAIKKEEMLGKKK